MGHLYNSKLLNYQRLWDMYNKKNGIFDTMGIYYDNLPVTLW